jgi:hypothetical protein
VSDEITRLPDSEVDGDEGWERLTDELDIRGVGATRSADFGPFQWQVWVAVAEFLRSEPLQSELWDGVTTALAAVPGVTAVHHEDRETWVVIGNPTEEALTSAAAEVVDGLADRSRQHYSDLLQ